jgi:hypothetical protein
MTEVNSILLPFGDHLAKVGTGGENIIIIFSFINCDRGII